MMRFLDPTNDLAFKKIFGNEDKKHILISFLNSLLRLPMQKRVTEVTILNPRQAPQLPGAKETILDVRCHDQSGAEYIVEMQVLPQEFFDKRVLYYAAKAYSQQLSIGNKYSSLRPVVFLGILDFEFTQDPHYLSTHCIHNVRTQEHILRDFSFTFVELPKFKKIESDLQTSQDKWLFFLKNADKLTAIPEIISEEPIRDAFEIVDSLHWDKDMLNLYTMRNIYVQDEINRVGYGYNKGRNEGLAEGVSKGLTEGLAQGLAQGLEQGLAQGFEQGQRQSQEAVVRAMLAKGMSFTAIVEYTGLPLEIIEACMQQ